MFTTRPPGRRAVGVGEFASYTLQADTNAIEGLRVHAPRAASRRDTPNWRPAVRAAKLPGTLGR